MTEEKRGKTTNSEHSKIDTIKRKERDAVGSEAQNSDSSHKLQLSQHKHDSGENQHMLLRSSHDVNDAR